MLKQPGEDPREGEWGDLPPLKPTKVTFFTMILYNLERHLTANWISTAKYYWNRPPPKRTCWIHSWKQPYLYNEGQNPISNATQQ